MNVNQVDQDYVRQLLERQIANLKAELAKAKAQLQILDSTKGSATSAGGRAKGGGRIRAAKFAELEQLILDTLDSEESKTNAIVKEIQNVRPEFSYEDIRRTLSRMKDKQLISPKKGHWKKAENAT